MPHCFSENEKKVLDVPFKVLDKGFVRLVDYMGDDKRIVQSARVSYGEGTKTVREDAALIDYLLRNSHSSPFEQVIFTFHMKLPVFVARQLARHRTARLNEISGRYSVLKSEAYVPTYDRIKKQAKDNKQGSGEEFSKERAKNIISKIEVEQDTAFSNYKLFIDKDIARELARINLPLSTYTEWYWQIDLNNLMKFLKLRLDSHAQWEIRQYAKAIYDITKVICPHTMESFDNHILNGIHISSKEKEALRFIIEHGGYWSPERLNLTEKQVNTLRNKLGL